MSIDWFALDISDKTGTGHIDVYKRDNRLFPKSITMGDVLLIYGVKV